MNEILKKYYERLNSIYLLNKLNNSNFKLLAYQVPNKIKDDKMGEVICMKNGAQILFEIMIKSNTNELTLKISSECFIILNNDLLKNYINSLQYVNFDNKKLCFEYDYTNSFRYIISCMNLDNVFNDLIDLLFESL